MTVRFKCLQVVENEQGRSVQLQALATDGSPENKSFFAAPAQQAAGQGQISLSLIADGVAFKPGKTYLVELSEVAQ